MFRFAACATHVVAPIACCFVFAGCAQQAEEPKVASSGEQPAYALHYPEEFSHAHAQFEVQIARATANTSDMAQFPEALSDKVDWALVESVYEQAHEEGAAQAYAQSYEEGSLVRRFFTEEQKPLVSRVAGAAQHAAKEKGHDDLKLYGPVNYGLERGVEAQLMERSHARSAAHMLIDDNQKELGADAKVLHEQADQISAARYIADIGLIQTEQRMRALQEESGAVRATLEERREKLSSEAKPDPKQQEQVEQALEELNTTDARVRKTLENAEAQAKQVKEAYDKAYESLIDKVEQKQADAEAKTGT